MKKITKILSLTVVVASMMTPLALLAKNTSSVNVKQEINETDGDASVELDNVDNDVEADNQVTNDANDTADNDETNIPEWIDSDECTALYSNEIASTWMGIANPKSMVFRVTKQNDNVHSGEVELYTKGRLDAQDLWIPAWIMVKFSSVTGRRYNVVGILSLDEKTESSSISGVINIPASIVSIGEDAFKNCSIGKIQIEQTNRKYALASSKSVGEANVVIDKEQYPDLNYDYASKPIGRLACGKITIPEDIVSIGNGVFGNCPGIKSFVLKPSTKLETIGNNAFSNCTGLTTLTIPDSVTSIGNEAFLNCTGLTGPLTIPASVTSIGNAAFGNGPHFTKINIAPENKKYGLADNLGANCNMILDKTIGLSFNETTTNIGCLVSGDVVMPQTVSVINDSIFKGCSSLVAVTIPTHVTSIGSNAFADCSNLENLDLLSAINLESINVDAFKNCFRLSNFNLLNASSLTLLSGFANCTKLTDINLNRTRILEEIGPFAFSGCTGLTGPLTLPASVITIGDSAFQNCIGLNGTLTIPLTVTTIGKNAFSGCTHFSGTLTIPPSLTSISHQAFFNIGSQEFRFLTENPPSVPGSSNDDIFGKEIKKILWVPNAQAKKAYDPLAAWNFGLLDSSYIKYHSSVPTSIDIINLEQSYDINLEDANEIIATAVADFSPSDALRDVDWFLEDAPTWLKIDTNGNIIANDELENVALGRYSFKVKATSKIAKDISKTTTDIELNVVHSLISNLEIEPITPVNVTLGAQATTLTTCKAIASPVTADPTKIRWAIPKDQPAWLDIDPTTGVISTNSSVIDKNLPASANYTVWVYSTDGHSKSDSATLTINFTKPEPTGIKIIGLNTVDGYIAKAGTKFETQLDWEALPDYAKKTEVIWDVTGPIGMAIDTNGKITYSPAQKLPEASFTVLCTSKIYGFTSQLTSKITVESADIASINIEPIAPVDIALGGSATTLTTCKALISPTTADSTKIKWSIPNNKPTWLDIDPITGVISTNSSVVDKNLPASANYTVQVDSTDGTNLSDTADLKINFIKPEPTGVKILNLNTTEGYTVKAGTKFEIQLDWEVIPDYAKTDVIWDVTGPAGMTIDASGKITYSPTQIFPRTSFTVTCESKNNSTIKTQLTSRIEVNSADVEDISIDTIGSFNLVLGENNPSLVTCSAIVYPNPEAEQAVTWSIENKPNWINIDKNTGVISIKDAIDIALLDSNQHTITVKATSNQDPTISETKNFSIHFSQPQPTNIEIDGLVDYVVVNNKQFSKKISVKVYPEYASPDVILSLKNAPAGMIIDTSGTIQYLPTSVAAKVDFQIVAKSNAPWATFTKEFNASITVVEFLKTDQFPTWAIVLLAVVGGAIVIGAATATGIAIHKKK